MSDSRSTPTGTSAHSGRLLEFGSYCFDPEGLLLFREREQVPLPPKAAGVLGVLLERPGQVVAKEELLDRVWGEGTVVADRSLSEAVGIVRQALDDDAQEPTYVQTVHRRGYRFAAPVRVLEDPALRRARGEADRFGGSVATGSTSSSARGWAIASGIVAIAIMAAAAAQMASRPGGDEIGPSPDARRVVISLPEEAPLHAVQAFPFAPALAISPDGNTIAYVSARDREGPSRLFLKALNRFGATVVPGTEQGASVPFFSPDGQWLGFLTDAVNKLRLGDRTPVRLAPVRVPWGATWGDDDIYFVQAASSGIFRVPIDGGEAEQVTRLDRSRNEEDHVWPQLLPGGETLLFGVMPESDEAADQRIEAQSLATGERRTILEGSEFARYLPSGHLVYVRDDSLWGRTFDLESLQPGDSEVRLLEGDPVGQSVAPNRLAISDEGTAVLGPREAFADVISIPREGEPVRVPVGRRFCRMPRFSPDGSRLAFTCAVGGSNDIWILDIGRGAMNRLTNVGSSLSPVWSPDGRRIAYGYRSDDAWRIEWKMVHGSLPAERILESEHPVFPQSFFPDGSRLVFLELHDETGEDIWSVSMEDGSRQPLVVTETDESGPRVSPDGRWLAYHSFESGSWEIYVRSLDDLDTRVQISTAGGGWPVWAPDNTQLLYYYGNFVAVDIGDGPELAPGTPRVIREPAGRILGDRKGAVFDISRDGDRLVAVEHGERPATRLYVIFDWFSELRALLPVE